MKIPRDLGAKDLIRVLNKFGYSVTRQTGSHIRLTCRKEVEHHITIPDHYPIKIGTLNSILRSVTAFLKLSRDDILKEL